MTPRETGRVSVRLAVALGLAASILAGADAPTAVPSVETLLNLGPTGVLAFFVYFLASGRLVPAALHDRADERAVKATAAAELSTKTAADAVAAVAKLTAEHEDERRTWEAELRAVQTELARIRGPVR